MPFFGVPIRNGLPIGLGSVAGFGVQQFDPSELFVGGTAGAWYDPSDLSTMFTTDAGTTPVAMPGAGAAVSVGRMLDKSGNGNHAISFNNTTARPELRARVNLLTYSEQFNNAAWTKSNVTATANTSDTTAPDGTNTADKILESGVNYHDLLYSFSQTSGVVYRFSVYVKGGLGRDACYIYAQNTTGGGAAVAKFNLNTGAYLGSGGGALVPFTTYGSESVGNEWFRIFGTYTASSTAAHNLAISLSDNTGPNINTYTGDPTKGMYVWGADLRPANIGANVPAYQRIADANTYDTNGFPLYLRFDGIDDSMYTPANLNLSGTDKVAVFAGVRKLSDAAQAVVTELSASVDTNNGSFRLTAPDVGLTRYSWVSKGTNVGQASDGVSTAPITSVLSGLGDIGGDSAILRVNGTQAGISTADQGTGNFGTYPLFIGARNNSSLWFNGHLHSLIIAGSAVSAGNISATEQWVAQRTGIAI